MGISTHYSIPEGDPFEILTRNLDNNIPLLTGMDSYTAYTDYPFAMAYHFVQLATLYPNSKFIFLNREYNSWLSSRQVLLLKLFKFNQLNESQYLASLEQSKSIYEEFQKIIDFENLTFNKQALYDMNRFNAVDIENCCNSDLLIMDIINGDGCINYVLF